MVDLVNHPSRITIKSAGTYLLGCSLMINWGRGYPSTTWVYGIHVNDDKPSSYSPCDSGASGNIQGSGVGLLAAPHTVLELSVNDYIETFYFSQWDTGILSKQYIWYDGVRGPAMWAVKLG
jgi:hypothetical protein